MANRRVRVDIVIATHTHLRMYQQSPRCLFAYVSISICVLTITSRGLDVDKRVGLLNDRGGGCGAGAVSGGVGG